MTHAEKVAKYMRAHKGVSLGEASKAVADKRIVRVKCINQK